MPLTVCAFQKQWYAGSHGIDDWRQLFAAVVDTASTASSSLQVHLVHRSHCRSKADNVNVKKMSSGL
jgi:hypothetical protein